LAARTGDAFTIVLKKFYRPFDAAQTEVAVWNSSSDDEESISDLSSSSNRRRVSPRRNPRQPSPSQIATPLSHDDPPARSSPALVPRTGFIADAALELPPPSVPMKLTQLGSDEITKPVTPNSDLEDPFAQF
jgi:hypothetical protein